MKLYITAFAVSVVTTLFLTPIVRRAARRIGIVDRPDQQRKLHAQPTPLGGGVAVLAGFLASLTVVLIFSDSQRSRFAANAQFVIGLVVSTVFIVSAGLFDDRYRLRGRQKLAAQIIAAGILVGSGLWIGGIEVLGTYIDLSLLALPFTLFWIVGAINALNLLDGMDGLATSVGLVLSLSVAAMAAITNHPTECFMALALAGALLGFLAFNRPPATIFLGDAGSMLIGLVLGALAIRASFKGPATVALIAPTALWAIPIFDVAMAILRRRLTGRSIYETDRNHLHHRLLGRGLNNAKTVAMIGLFCGVTAAAAVFSIYIRNELLAVSAVLAVIVFLVIFRVFGHQELYLLAQRVRNLVHSLIPVRSSLPRAEPLPTYARLQGSREWEEAWKTLINFANQHDVASVQLNLNLPMIAEEFHAEWNRKQRPVASQLWHSDIPLLVNDLPIGRLRLMGSSHSGSSCSLMSEILAGLLPFERQLSDMINEHLLERVGSPEMASGVVSARQ